MGFADRLDAAQQKHPALGFPLAVLYKYVDDQGGYLAALIAYYAFLSLFPLLLLFSTILGWVLLGHPALRDQLMNSALSEFPVIGTQLGQPKQLSGGVPGRRDRRARRGLRRTRGGPGPAERDEHGVGGAAKQPAQSARGAWPQRVAAEHRRCGAAGHHRLVGDQRRIRRVRRRRQGRGLRAVDGSQRRSASSWHSASPQRKS